MSNSQAQKQFREAGVVGVILQVLDIHSNDASATKSAVSAIWALAQDDENRCLFVEAGAVEKVITTMNKHLENDEIVEVCTNTLNVLNKDMVVNNE